MSNTELATTQSMSQIEQVVITGDIKSLTPEQRVEYYKMRCEAADLDFRTQPFSYIILNGKLTLYATKTATEQLCEKRKLSCEIIKDGMQGDLYKVQSRVSGIDGRHTDNIGVVTASNLKGEALANAMMKAVTKSYRRAVLSHCGLGMLDETEAETIPGAQFVEAEPVEPLATIDDIAIYNKARLQAIEMGYRTKSGNEPKELAEGATKADAVKRTNALQKWLDEQIPEPITAKAMGDDGSKPIDPLCDSAKYMAKYFSIAEGTAYKEAAGRASFVSDATQGAFDSLSKFLNQATTPEAQKLCTDLQSRITADKGEMDDSDPFADEGEPTEEWKTENLRKNIAAGKGTSLELMPAVMIPEEINQHVDPRGEAANN